MSFVRSRFEASGITLSVFGEILEEGVLGTRIWAQAAFFFFDDWNLPISSRRSFLPRQARRGQDEQTLAFFRYFLQHLLFSFFISAIDNAHVSARPVTGRVSLRVGIHQIQLPVATFKA